MNFQLLKFDPSRTVKNYRRIQPIYRGSITDYCRSVTLGSGYIGKWRLTNRCRNCAKQNLPNCAHFEIDTAKHLEGVFKAIDDENVRMIMLRKAAQTAGSLTWDMALHFLLVHSRYMRIKVYFCDSDEKAKRYCDERLMDTLKNNADIKPLLPTGAMRYDDKKAEIKLLNGKHLIVCALNDSTASSLPADVIIIDEAWLASAGLLKKAIDRTKQQHGYKIIIVSQAGDVGEEMDNLWNQLHKKVPLTWECPCCHSRQQFELHKERKSDFKAVEIAGLTPPQAGTYCGFKFPKKISEMNTPEEIKAGCAAVTVECFHCGFEIADTHEMRQKLQQTYNQEYREQTADGHFYTPKDYSVGFWNPDSASVFVPFSETAEAFVLAKKAYDDFKNKQPLKDFYLSRWAQPWDENMSERKTMKITVGFYESDPSKMAFAENTFCRQMTVDCGKSPDAAANEDVIGTLFFEIRDWEKRSNSRQVARGMVQDCVVFDPKADGKRKVSAWELLQAQIAYWKVTARRTLIDVAWMPSQVIEAALKNFELIRFNGEKADAKEFGNYPMAVSSWRGCEGSQYRRIGVEKKSFMQNSLPQVYFVHDELGRRHAAKFNKITWSNYVFEDLFNSIVNKQVGFEWSILPQDKVVIAGLDGKPDEELTKSYLSFERDIAERKQFRSWDSGLHSRYLDDKTKKWEDLQKRPAAGGIWTEPRDLGLMQLAGVAIDGLLGNVGQENTGE